MTQKVEASNTPDPDLQYDQDLEDFLLANKKANSTSKLDVFRRREGAKGRGKRTKWEFMDSFEDEVLGFKDVGEDFGKGDYQLQVTYTDKHGNRKFITRSVTISEEFEKRRIVNQGQPAQLQAQPAGLDAGSTAYLATLQTQNQMMFETMLGMMDKVITNGNKEGNDKWQDKINGLILANATANQELLTRVTQNKLKEIDPDVSSEDEEFTNLDAWEIVKYVWENFGEKVLKGSKWFQKKARSQLEGTEELRDLLANPDAYEFAYDKLCEKANQEDVDRLLSVLQLPTPEELKNTLPLPAAQ